VEERTAALDVGGDGVVQGQLQQHTHDLRVRI